MLNYTPGFSPESSHMAENHIKPKEDPGLRSFDIPPDQILHRFLSTSIPAGVKQYGYLQEQRCREVKHGD